MFNYLFAFIILIVIILIYFKIANQLNIIDKPNERSSHANVTIRGGGIIFPAAVILWLLIYGFNQPWIILGLLLMAVVSFLDDVITLTSWIRILIHFLAVSLLFWQLQVYNLSWYGIVLAYLVTIGWINAFNFMDGINGITAFYSLVSIGTFAWLNYSLEFISEQLIIILILSTLIFSFFNARKIARTFAGDVGSVSMAFILAWFMISLLIKSGHIEYILLFAVYGIDSVITIIFRLLRQENIFNAHRTHLFQYLSNELKLPQILVSSVYGFIQFGINILTISLIAREMMTWQVFAGLLLFISIGYLIIRHIVSNSIKQKSNILI